jgi:hypothetical protein
MIKPLALTLVLCAIYAAHVAAYSQERDHSVRRPTLKRQKEKVPLYIEVRNGFPDPTAVEHLIQDIVDAQGFGDNYTIVSNRDEAQRILYADYGYELINQWVHQSIPDEARNSALDQLKRIPGVRKTEIPDTLKNDPTECYKKWLITVKLYLTTPEETIRGTGKSSQTYVVKYRQYAFGEPIRELQTPIDIRPLQEYRSSKNP